MKKERLSIDYLIDIFHQTFLIQKFIKGIKFQKFSEDYQLTYAVTRALEIIGEAVKKIPKEIRANYKTVDWSEVAKMRDMLIHYYYGADEKIIWNTCKKDIKVLKSQIIIIIDDVLQTIIDDELKNKLQIRISAIKKSAKK